jgi:phosphohistidine phosphatase
VKILYIVRHAKSSWDQVALDDFERPLNDRGHRNAIMLGKLLKDHKITPDLLISSPANRAAMTARLISEQIKYSLSNIVYDPELYLATSSLLYDILRKVKNEYDQVMIVGHNPGMTALVNDLADEQVPNLPTCSIYGLRLKIKTWSELTKKCGQKILYESPKKYGEGGLI